MGSSPAENFMRPCETAARLRVDIGSDDVAKAGRAYLKAADCLTCAFRGTDKTCRAWPPRPLADGRPVWPKVGNDDWCGCWRAM